MVSLCTGSGRERTHAGFLQKRVSSAHRLSKRLVIVAWLKICSRLHTGFLQMTRHRGALLRSRPAISITVKCPTVTPVKSANPPFQFIYADHEAGLRVLLQVQKF